MSAIEVIVGIVAVVALLGIVGWRSGGMREQKLAREAERNKELDE